VRGKELKTQTVELITDYVCVVIDFSCTQLDGNYRCGFSKIEMQIYSFGNEKCLHYLNVRS
jgi:hypothetical protein